jgi:hypothetical protein
VSIDSTVDDTRPRDLRKHLVTDTLRNACVRDRLGVQAKAQPDAIKLPPLRRDKLALVVLPVKAK